MEDLQALLSYQFQNPALLEEALTHPSLAYETQRAVSDNQRLEFLGDAVLQLIITEELFERHDHMPEGDLTKLRSTLVSRTSIARYALRMGLGEKLRMGKGEDQSGGRSRPSSLADAFEALIGAVFVDGGYQECRRVLRQLLHDDLTAAGPSVDEFNPKGLLQEILQSHAPEAPIYEIVREEGPDHSKVFVSRVVWKTQELGMGTGASKKQAEAAAARDALASPEVVAYQETRISG
jgi:ribonuclease-3